MKIRALLIACGLLLSACITPVATVVPTPANVAALAPPRTYVLNIQLLPTTELGKDEAYRAKVLRELESDLNGRLWSMGYKATPTGERPALAIDLWILALKEGSQAARLLIGMGAGRASIKFNAIFSDAAGNELARFQGGDANTGMLSPFQSNDAVASGAASAAVEQVETFLRNGGRFPEKPKATAPHGPPGQS